VLITDAPVEGIYFLRSLFALSRVEPVLRSAPDNHAATLYPMHLVKQQGFDQLAAVVRWRGEKYFTGKRHAMNVFFQINNVLITPPLDEGTILNGVTRDSVITLDSSDEC
jgi:hypothetical protein